MAQATNVPSSNGVVKHDADLGACWGENACVGEIAWESWRLMTCGAPGRSISHIPVSNYRGAECADRRTTCKQSPETQENAPGPQTITTSSVGHPRPYYLQPSDSTAAAPGSGHRHAVVARCLLRAHIIVAVAHSPPSRPDVWIPAFARRLEVNKDALLRRGGPSHGPAMTSKPMAERRKSDNGTVNGNNAAPFLSPESAQGSTHTHPSLSSTNSGQLLPSPIPPPTASSVNSHNRPQSRVSAVSGNSRNSHSDGTVRKSHSQSVSSTPHTLASSSRTLSAENKERQRNARTLPRKTSCVVAMSREHGCSGMLGTPAPRHY